MRGTLSFLCGVSLWEARNPQKQAQVLAEHPCCSLQNESEKRTPGEFWYKLWGNYPFIASPASLSCCPGEVQGPSEWPLEGSRLPGFAELGGGGLGPWGLTGIPFRSLSWFPSENECGLCSDGGWREKTALSQGFENNSPCLWPSGTCLVD